ncbi:MAG: 3',5'-cyclic-nucleotide phosphodiesterase [uncultured Corynebacteriales bacterium]|uniref:3',5'-cyclic-nucleotide phosphodiesterase n=1 Tax=uncultured Mycobacteriales bacterium TaxID=581187 RepID=A0A6J4JX23_9ACTN|nr:MAG: 3',5'-cyclic-nucleotide phosphodiesterase [uncultured Corynebacteriales bacterium]
MSDLPAPIRVPYRLAGTALSTVLAAGSALRHARVFHPVGVAYAVTVDVEPDGTGPWGAPLLDRPATLTGLVRLSRGTGLPDGLPDVLGLALRLTDAHGPGRHQDLLVNTAGRGPLVRQVFLPARGFGTGRYSSVLPYRVGAARVLFGARPVGPGDLRTFAELDRAAAAGALRFRLEVARPGGRWRPVGTITVGERLPAEVAEELRFNVNEHTGGGIAPVGALQELRRQSYRLSQRHRP